jgi:hypothetical protein
MEERSGECRNTTLRGRDQQQYQCHKHNIGPCVTFVVHKSLSNIAATHTYLDGARPFMFWERGLRKSTIARRPCPQWPALVCMGFGSCTVSIFSCPAFGPRAGRAIFFWHLFSSNPSLGYLNLYIV